MNVLLRPIVSMRLGLATLSLLSAMSAGHAAECLAPPFNPDSNWCNDCTYEGWMAVKRNQTCVRPFRPTTNAKTIAEISGDRVVQRASHGTAELKGSTITYAPSRGYVGDDSFTVAMTYRRSVADKGRFFVHLKVVVQQ